MNMILMTATLLGTISTENDLLNQKGEETYSCLSSNDLYFTSLTLTRKKRIGGTRREVVLQTLEWFQPFGKKKYMRMWKGTYIVIRTDKELLIKCRFLEHFGSPPFESSLKGKVFKAPLYKPETVTFHVEKFTPGEQRASIQVYFTAEKSNRLHFWNEKESINLY